jgi:hypothetical protein
MGQQPISANSDWFNEFFRLISNKLYFCSDKLYFDTSDKSKPNLKIWPNTACASNLFIRIEINK